MKNKWFNLLDLYFLIVSIIWLVWWLIGWGTALYSYIDHKIISDDEYLARNYYQMDACETDSKYVASETQPQQKDQKQIDTCKEQAKKKLLADRSYQLKQDLIWGIVWGSIFFIVFLIHFPFFVVRNIKKDVAKDEDLEIIENANSKEETKKNKKK